MPPRTRRYDPAKVKAALFDQWDALIRRTDALTAAELAAPSRLAGWSTADLVAHIALGASRLVSWLSAPAPPGTRPERDLADWASGTADVRDAVAGEATRSAGLLPRDTVPAARALVAQAPPERLVGYRTGSMTLADVLITRLVEAVVHADDLDPGFPHARAALATVTRALADIAAVRAPGGSVELRVPPFAVVQCVAGPRHTRGTPPSVVEAEPLTWLRLATGRTRWPDALADGSLRASGERSDISGLLPLLR